MESQLAQLHQKYFDEQILSITKLKGDGSARNIYRIRGKTHTSIEIHGNNAAENNAFIGFTKTFRSHHLNVPEIFITDLDKNIYIEEDLGDTTFYDWMTPIRKQEGFSPTIAEMYHRVIVELPKFQIFAAGDIDYNLCYQYNEFGFDSMLFDLQYFRNKFLSNFYKRTIDDIKLEKEFYYLIQYLYRAKRDYFLYRDFQSRNIIIHHDQLYFIDYQSGRRGALQYDVASLLEDSRAEIPFGTRKSLIEIYLDAAHKYTSIDRDEFKQYYNGYALIRILQALGAFGNLGFIQQKIFFLESIPYAMNNIELFLQQKTVLDEMPYLKQILESLVMDTTLRSLH